MVQLDEILWQRLLRREAADGEACPLYGPLLRASAVADGCLVLGRLAQSLDGRIATESGASRWISGQAELEHTHRLRALFDAIVVGAGTVRADDPQLNTRLVVGPSPVRVVIDTNRRLGERYKVFQVGPPALLCTAADSEGPDYLGAAQVVRLPRSGEGLDPAALLTALAARGLRRILIEGGGVTISRFLVAEMLDRLHVTVAPLLLGGGVPAFTLRPALVPADGLRFDWTVHPMAPDILLDIPLRRVAPIAN